MESGSHTVTYSALYTGTEIYKVSSSGTTTTVVSTTSGPSNGTFTANQGDRIVSTDPSKPIHLFVENAGHAVAPESLEGEDFQGYMNRNNPATLNFYSKHEARVKIFNPGNANGRGYDDQSNLLMEFEKWHSLGANSLPNYSENGDGNSRIVDASPKGQDIVWDVSNQDGYPCIQ